MSRDEKTGDASFDRHLHLVPTIALQADDEAAGDYLVDVSNRSVGHSLADAGAPQVPASLVAGLHSALATYPLLAEALKAGKLVRIVGPRSLLGGLKSGALRYIVKGEGHTGTVVHVDTGRIAGQVEMQLGPSRAQLGALAVFQIASAVTLQYYLQQLFEQLAALRSDIADIKQLLEARTRGELQWAAREAAALEAKFDRGFAIAESDRAAVQSAIDFVGPVREQALLLLERFGGEAAIVCQRIDDTRGRLITSRVVSKSDVRRVLDQALVERREDFITLLVGSALLARLLYLRLMLDVWSVPADASGLQREFDDRVGQMQADLATALGYYRSFDAVEAERLSEVFVLSGTVERELESYHEYEGALVAAAASTEWELRGGPKLIEIKLVDGVTDVRVAALDAAAGDYA